MPSRLDELRRQRALLQEHLDWLENEIELSAGAAPVSAPAAAPPPPPRPTATRAPVPSPQAAAEAERLFAEFRAEEEKHRPPPSKAGCWTMFSLILLVLIGIVGGLLYFLYR
jgi:hypothetical protein